MSRMKKGYTQFMGAFVVGAVLLGVLWYNSTNVPCGSGSRDSRCWCPEGESKVRTNDDIDTYACVPETLPVQYSFPMDSSAGDFSNQAIAYAQAVLRERFPSCDVQCGSPSVLEIYPSIGVSGEKGYAECMRPIEGGHESAWRVVFLLQDGALSTTQPPYCRV